MRIKLLFVTLVTLIGVTSAAPKATWIPQRLRMKSPSFFENSIGLSQKPKMSPMQGYEQPQVYRQPQQGYEQPQVYSQPQQGYEQPQVYSQPQQKYEQPQVYSQPQQRYEQPQQGYGSYGNPSTQVNGQVSSCNPNPCLNEGKCTVGSNGIVCKCPWGWAGARCEICLTECASNPCKAPKKCKAKFGGGFECVCPSNRLGGNCEIFNDLCSSNPCKNGAVCSPVEGGSYTCECKKPWSGPSCDQVWQNPCTEQALRNTDIHQYKNPWDRNSYIVCLDINRYHTMPCSVGTYFNENLHHCVPEGYNPPACPQNYCQNSGECLVDEYNLLKCVCKKGFSGDRCEENIDECLLEGNSKCSGGTCVDQINGYYCQCPNGIGLSCQETIKNPCTTQNLDNDNYYHEIPSQSENSYIHCTGENVFTVSKCADNLYWHPEERTCTVEKPIKKYGSCLSLPCKNGAECEETDGTNYKCLCKDGYTGANCEQIIDYCLSNPCQNGGRCLSYSGGYTCVCQDKVIDDCCCNGVLNPCPSRGELVPGVNNYFPHLFKNKYIHCDFDGRAFVRSCAPTTNWNQEVLSCLPDKFKLDKNYLHDNVQPYGTEAYGYNIGSSKIHQVEQHEQYKKKNEESYAVKASQIYPINSIADESYYKTPIEQSSYNNEPEQINYGEYNKLEQSNDYAEQKISSDSEGPQEEQQPSYASPQEEPQPSYALPQQSSYAQQPQEEQQPSYAPPQEEPQPSYALPQQPSYAPPQEEQQYNYVPQQSSYAQQPQEEQQPSYAPPQEEQQYNYVPQQSSYAQQPQQPSYTQPPQQPSYAQPPQQPSYTQPPQQPSYAQPPQQPQQPSYFAPQKPSYIQQSLQPSYAQSPQQPQQSSYTQTTQQEQQYGYVPQQPSYFTPQQQQSFSSPQLQQSYFNQHQPEEYSSFNHQKTPFLKPFQKSKSLRASKNLQSS